LEHVVVANGMMSLYPITIDCKLIILTLKLLIGPSELADVEVEHLVNDEIILFQVTTETFGNGSLLLKLDFLFHKQFEVIKIEPSLSTLHQK
jgi:hypothetical protein